VRYKPTKAVISGRLEMTEKTVDHSSDLLLRMEEADELQHTAQRLV